MARVSSPTGLPAFAHRPGAVRPIELAGRGVEVITARHHRTAVSLTDEVDRESIELPGVGNHPTVDPQTRHSAVRKSRQPDVRESPRVGDGKDVLLIAAER